MDPEYQEDGGGNPVSQSGVEPRQGSSPGCTWLLILLCGSLLLAGLLISLLAYLNFGSLVTSLEKTYIREALDHSGVDPRVRDRVEQVLQEYDGACREVSLSPSQWKAAARAFQQSPAAAVLALMEARAKLAAIRDLKPEERERAQQILDRLARAISAGELPGNGLQELIRQSSTDSDLHRKDEVQLDPFRYSARDVRTFTRNGEELLSRHGVGEEPFNGEELPRLIRRDLWKSLEAGKGD